MKKISFGLIFIVIILIVKSKSFIRNKLNGDENIPTLHKKISNNTNSICANIIKKFSRDVGILNKGSKLKLKENCKLKTYDYFMESLIMNESKYKMIRFFLKKRTKNNENINMKKLFFDRINLIQNIFKNIKDCTLMKKKWRRKLRKLDKLLVKIKREKCKKTTSCEFGKRENINTLFNNIHNIFHNSKEKKELSNKLGSILTNIYLKLLVKNS